MRFCAFEKNLKTIIKNHMHFNLIGWALWPINLCRLLKAKSNFRLLISSISSNSV